MLRGKTAALSFLILLVSIHGHSPTLANPSHKEIEAPLDIHNIANSQEILGQAKGLYEQSAQSIQGIVKSGGRASARTLTQAHISIRRLHRSALDLQLHGEPAGYDFDLRYDSLKHTLDKALGQFKQTQAGVAHANKLRQILRTTKSVQARNAAARKIQQLAQQKKWLEAYTVLNEAMDELTSMTVFLEFQETQDLLRPFEYVITSVPSSRHKFVRQQLLDSMGQVAADQMPRTQELLTRITAAANGLRSAPTADIDGRSFTGPQCLGGFVRLWRQVHLSALRCRAIDWARHVSIPDALSARPASEPNRVADTEYAQFYTEVTKALASLIEADAQRASGDEVRALYRQYIDVLAPVITRTADDKLEVAATTALEKLAAKLPEFSKEVEAYQEATGELLRWRARVALAKARSHAAQFEPSDQLMLRVTTSKPDFRGLLNEKTPILNSAALIGSCPVVLSVASPGVLDQRVTAHNVVGLSGGTLCVARYNSRHYTMVAKPNVTNEIQSLKEDLLITDEMPPLSLAAATAIRSGEQGDYVAVGGVVKGVHLEGLIPRFAVLSEGALPFVALGPMPAEPREDALLSHVLMRFDVLPSWVHHKYFFLQVNGAGNSGTGG